MELYLKKSKVKNMVALLDKYEGEIDIEKFEKALSEVDTQMKNLPATAQVSWTFIFIFPENLVPSYSFKR